jgi:hypothetical protein
VCFFIFGMLPFFFFAYSGESGRCDLLRVMPCVSAYVECQVAQPSPIQFTRRSDRRIFFKEPVEPLEATTHGPGPGSWCIDFF